MMCAASGLRPTTRVDFLGLDQCPHCGAWLRPTRDGSLRHHPRRATPRRRRRSTTLRVVR